MGKQQKGFWLGIGFMVGSVVGLLIDNIALWFPLGLVIGAVLEITQRKLKSNSKP